MRIQPIALSVFLGLATLIPTALAQDASLTGIISDQSGAVLPGVAVTITNLGTNIKKTTLTNISGGYTILELPPATYRLEAELLGFRKYVRNDIALDIEQEARIDIQMEIGQLNHVVYTTAEEPLLNTEKAGKGSVVHNEEVSKLPLESRDFFDLSYLTVGVVPEPQGGQGGFASINGARQDSMNFAVDGGNNSILRAGDATVRPSLDAVQEFRVQTSNYSAEFGRRSTGVISMVLRSGTNKFHGLLFHYHRNSALDARNFFDNQKSKLIRNNFGGNLGGPIVRDKAFFFFNYEGMRLREGQTRLQRTPTLAERAGDFSSLSTKIKDPISGKNFTNNKITADRIHPVSTKLLQFFPLPNVDRGAFNYTSNKVDKDSFNDYVSKVDLNFRNGDTLAARYLFNNRFQDNPFNGSDFPGFGRDGTLRFQMAGINYSHMFSPRIVSQAMLNFSRKNSRYFSYNSSKDYCALLGIPGCTTDSLLIGFPRITVQGYGNMGDAAANPDLWTENDYQAHGTITWVKGQHILRFGGEMIRTQLFQLFANNARGLFNFRDRWSGNSFADFLLGMMNNTNRRIKSTTNYLFSRTWAGFSQDDWKIGRNLTVNLGVRWDYFSPPADKYNNWSNFYPELGRIVLAGEAGFPESLVYSNKRNFAPRIGIAWRMAPKTVVRTGFGQFYGLSILNPIRTALGGNPPFTILETYSRLASKPLLLTWDNPFPEERRVLDGVDSPSGYESHPPSALLNQYSLTMERELRGNMVFEISYVGSKGTHLPRTYNVNQLFRELQPDGSVKTYRNFASFSGIDYFAFEANSNYNALQVSLQKRGRGVNFRFNYSLSKSIDGSSRLSGAADAGVEGVQDARNRAAERGLSDFDRRHALSGSLLYSLPFRRNFLVRGWQINSLWTFFSGTPITPKIANADQAAGEATRPDRIGSGILDNPTPEMWFKVSDFPPVPAGSYRMGNSGRNVVPGPSRKNWSVSVVRQFRLLSEDHHLQFRWEFYNWPNWVSFYVPNVQVNIATAGAVSQAYPSRQMQVALKYIF